MTTSYTSTVNKNILCAKCMYSDLNYSTLTDSYQFFAIHLPVIKNLGICRNLIWPRSYSYSKYTVPKHWISEINLSEHFTYIFITSFYYLASDKWNLTEIQMKVFRRFTAGMFAAARVFLTNCPMCWWHRNGPGNSWARSFLPSPWLYPLNWYRPCSLELSVTL